MSFWNNIDTPPPTDGWYLVGNGEAVAHTAVAVVLYEFHDGQGHWAIESDEDEWLEGEPTHWAPIPSLP
jgi:hypothetical protein